MPAPKEQPPRKLSGKRTARGNDIWKETPAGFGLDASADGIILSGTATDGASTGCSGWSRSPARARDACARPPATTETHAAACAARLARRQAGSIRRL